MRYALAALFAIAGTLSGQALQIATDSLPAATVGVAYLQQLPVSGGNCAGVGGTAASTVDGALPSGVSVTSPPGVKQWSVQGTPTVSGTFNFTLHIMKYRKLMPSTCPNRCPYYKNICNFLNTNVI